MIKGKIYVGQICDIELDTQADIIAAPSAKIKAMRPDGTTTEWTAEIVGTKVLYTTQPADANSAGDLDMPGVWRFQPVPQGFPPGETHREKIYARFA